MKRLAALALLIPLAACGSPATPAAPADTATQPAAASEAPKEAPKWSVSQQQAIRKAEQYIGMMAFAPPGLIRQLEFEGFTTEEATIAVENLDVDWSEQAAKKAKDYLKMQGFSRDALIQQLEFEGFTAEQAAHGADSVGL